MELTDHGDPRSTPSATTPWPSWPRHAGLQTVATNNVHYATPARRRWPPRSPPCGPGAAWTRSTAGCRPPATAHLRSGAEMAPRFAALPGCGGRRRRVRPGSWPSTCPWSRRSCPAYPVPAGHTEMSWLRELTYRRSARSATAPGPRRTRRRTQQIDHELRDDRGAGVPGLLPGGLRHREVLPRAGHLLPGAGVGGELGGLLRAADHQRGRGEVRSCCSSGSSPRSATARRTSTWTSSPTVARRPSSTSTSRYGREPHGPGRQRHLLPAAVGGA